MAIPFPLKVILRDPVTGKPCTFVLIDYKPQYGMAEYRSECSGRTVMLTAEEAWAHAAR